MSIIGDLICTKQLQHDKPRFQNINANKPVNGFVRNAVSQIYGFLGRITGFDVNVGLRDVGDALRLMGYPQPVLQNTCRIIAVRHPYLEVSLRDVWS